MQQRYSAKRSGVNGWMVATVMLGAFMIALATGWYSNLPKIFGSGAPSGGVEATIVLLLAMAASVFVYFLPTFVAVKRGHHQAAPIIILNFFLGWTLIGWVASLAWSVSPVKK